MTVIEGIVQVYSLSSGSCRILACAPSNSASDLIVRRGKEREREGGREGGREAEGERKREREREGEMEKVKQQTSICKLLVSTCINTLG